MKSSSHPPPSLRDLLLDRLNPAIADQLIADLTASGYTDQLQLLLMELREASSKIAGEAVWALQEFQRRCGLEVVIPWLDLGICFTQASGAIALRYFKDSPLILGVMEDQSQRKQVLELTLELADEESEVIPTCAFEFFKKSPELLLEMPVAELGIWARIGVELAKQDYVLGIEFLKESPSIARVVGQDHVRDWISLGTKLVTTNSLGKTDYVGTLEFFRSSPALLSEVSDPELRPWVVNLGSVLADQSPTLAVSFLAEAPTLLGKLSFSDWRLRVVNYALLIADRDAETTLAYLRRAPEILQVGGNSDDALAAFENWFRGGMEVLEYSAEGGLAYFSLETRNALASVEQAMSGIPLRQVARSLKLFAQGMCGRDVSIEALSHSANDSGSQTIESLSGPKTQRPKVSPDGKVILLPSIMRLGVSREENLRWYTVMTAHEAGHIEFGTYHVPLDSLQQLAKSVQARYSREARLEDGTDVQTLGDLFALYPQPGVIRDLWEILEDARVDYLLQQEYPGLRQDLAHLNKEAVRIRSFLHGMTAREMVIDSLLLHFTTEPSQIVIRDDLKDVVFRMWALAKGILHSDAASEEAIQMADRLYQVLDEMIGRVDGADQKDWNQESADEESDLGPGPRAAEETAGEYSPITNWSYRGEMDPDLVHGDTDSEMNAEQANSLTEKNSELQWPNPSDHPPSQQQGHQKDLEQDQRDQGQQEFGASPMQQWLDLEGNSKSHRQVSLSGSQQILYDEWDGIIRDYRPKWCRVAERIGPEGSPDFVDQTLEAYGPAVRLLRRYFETIRPMAFRRLGRQDHGDDFDMDAVVQRVVDRRRKDEPSDRVYFRREKRERQVAVSFLLDMSGSTGRQIGAGQRRVIDVEKEGLILLAEALSAIGDQFALYAYSGQGRGHIDIVQLKDFHDSSLGRAALRISAITPLQQNRDGAAIRHMTQSLCQQSARTRILVLVSDGKPMDDGYGDEYSLEDTKMALREARMKGIHPFCITVDQTASDYLKRMYGEVGFVVIDDVGSLPTRLPQIYQRLTT